MEIRNINFLLNGHADVMMSVSSKMRGNIYMASVIQNLIEESISDVTFVEIEKISPRKWQLCFIHTEENSYNVEDDGIYMSPANYDIKRFKETCEIYTYNSFFGVRKEMFFKKEVAEYKSSFMIYDENDVEVPQEKLKEMYEKKGV